MLGVSIFPLSGFWNCSEGVVFCFLFYSRSYRTNICLHSASIWSKPGIFKVLSSHIFSIQWYCSLLSVALFETLQTKDNISNTRDWLFHRYTFAKDPTVTVKCRTAIKVLFLYINLCLSVMFDNLSYLFTFIYFLTNYI